MYSVEMTLMAQYANATKLRGLIESFNEAVGPEDFIDSFYDMVWNIKTADTYGLDVWGKIVVVSRLISVTPNEVYFGFNEASSATPVSDDPQPFNQAPFYTRGSQQTSTVALGNDAFRKLILVKAAANITNCTVKNLNYLLNAMFGEKGRCYVRNDGGMQISYVFEFALSPSDLAIIQNSGAFPAPAGVLVNIVQQAAL